jgi:RHS repeat-associated protein
MYWWDWQSPPGHQAGSVQTLAVREFRGDGRGRYMMRDRCANANGCGSVPQYEPLYDTAVWTDYDGDRPWGDYSVSSCDSDPDPQVFGPPTIEEQRHYELGLSEIDRESPDAVSYTHTDHLGTTRAQTNEQAIPEQIVYTAFGEPVSGDLSTRYAYVGRHGYESFDDLNWGTWNGQPVAMPFLHVGRRWYDTLTGRFLQRDPSGIRGGMNVYSYVHAGPLSRIDPSGLSQSPIFQFGPGAEIYPRDIPTSLSPPPTVVVVDSPGSESDGGHSSNIPEPFHTYHRIEGTLILIGPGMVGATVAEAMNCISGEWFWGDYGPGDIYQQVLDAIKDEWR